MATSSNQSGFVDSWQRGKSVMECNLHMLETEDMSDVTFLVGFEKHVVRAHRYVLASRSCVFHAMFCGRMAEQGEITIPDVEVNVFKDFLRFLYTDDILITLGNVIGLMYIARKYDVETLFVKSTTFLANSLSEENLCQILERSHEYGETDLEEKALGMLRHSSTTVIKSPAFPELCSGCFRTFMKSEHLNLTDEEVFKAALSWTKRECEREGLSPSHENMRKILGELVYEIRFVNFSLEFLTKVVGPSGLLTGDERVRIMDRKVDSSVNISPFKFEGLRKTVNYMNEGLIFKLNIFPETHEESYFRFRSVNSISFHTNNPITLLGCQLYGNSTDETSRLNIQVRDDRNHLISHPVQNTYWTLSDTVNDVMFPDPISIEAQCIHRIIVHYRQRSLLTGFGGQSRVKQAGVEFTFVPSHLEGQIPGLIWRL